MRLYVTELSRYVIAGLMLVYTVLSFLILKLSGERKRSGLYAVQIVVLFATQIACYVQIIAKTGSINYLFLFAFQIVILFATITLFRMLYPDGNRLVIHHMCLLLMIGMVMVSRISYDKAVRQFVIAAGSTVIAFAIPEIFYRLAFLKHLWPVYALFGIGALGAVLILGRVVHGSKLNYTIGGLTFQPSELIKIVFILCIASLLQERQDLLRVALATVLAAAHVLILVYSRDLGSALIFFVTYLTMLFIATANVWYLFSGIGAGALASVVAYRLFPHIRTRVQAWRDPWSQIDGAGYQVAQSLFGISSGGAFGLGLYGGAPGDIPYVERDSIFSAIAEELGLVFAVCMILVCVSCFLMILWEAERVQDGFCRLVAAGIGVTYVFQVFLTVGGGTKFIPLTGVTLPLVSYGGTSVLVTIWMFALFEGVCLVGTDERYQQYLTRMEEP